MADNLPIPEFFERNVAEIIADSLAYYKAVSGRDIHPADPEMLIVNVFAYRELVLRNAGNDAAMQMLLRYSRFPILDYLVELVGVTRLAATNAGCILEITLNPGHGDLVIPVGTRVSSADGAVTFETIDPVIVDALTDVYQIGGLAQSGGVAGNGYVPGTVNVLIDVQAYIDTIENIDVTAGGSDEETDDALRERAKLAPNAFSVAGPTDAYKFFALGAHPTIIDVGIDSDPGIVRLYPLSTAGVPTPQFILDLVYAACSGEKKVPFLDTVVVESAVAIDYDIEVELELYADADEQLTLDTVNEALSNFTLTKSKKLGLDVIRKQIEKLCIVDGMVYNLNLISPAADIVVDDKSFGNIGTITVTVTGLNNG